MPYQIIDIQYLSKPEITIPNNFSKASILLNFYQNHSKSKQENFEYALDSVASGEAVQSLKFSLEKTPWFENIDIPIIKYVRSENSKYIKPIAWDTLYNLSNQDSTDLMISLEYIKVQPRSDSYKSSSNGTEFYYGYLQVPVYCYWRVYSFQEKKIQGYLYKDTLLWDAKDWIPIEVGNQLPGYFKSVAYVGGEAGDTYSQKISPTWTDDKRLLFNSGSVEMEKATKYAIQGQWIDAASEWQKVLLRNRKKLSAKAAYNLALASEMLGKFDLSLEWLIKAKKFYPLFEIDQYRSVVERRITNN